MLIGLAREVCTLMLVGCSKKPQVISDKTVGDGPCTLTVEESPQLRGFKLGMTPNQVRTIFPHLPDHSPNELGWAGILIAGVSKSNVQIYAPSSDMEYLVANLDDQRYPALNKVRLRLELIDGQLSLIKVHYLSGEKWNSNEEFLKHINGQLGLPGEWTGTSYRTLKCQDFFVFAGLSHNSIAERILKETRDQSSVSFALYDFSRSESPFVMLMGPTYNPIQRKITRQQEKERSQQMKEEKRKETFKP